MARSCGQVKRGLVRLCEPAAGGLRAQLVLVRQADIASATRSTAVRKGVRLTLKANTIGFLFEGIGDSNVGRVKLTRGKYGPKYAHEIDFASFSSDPQNLETLEDLAKDTVVAIVPANDGFYKIYGLGAGLTLNKADSDTANEDIGAGAEATLSSTKEGGREDLLWVETTPGVYDPIATKALFESFFEDAEIVEPEV